MHEMSVCQALIRQVELVARERGVTRVDNIVLSIGPLSGIEPQLLNRAFSIARLESQVENAQLEIETGPVVVQCRSCGASGEALVNRLLCPDCGDWKVNLVQGDELLLLRLETIENPA
jgi:hydrogenase nickel incorporation protein HypA/HybF